jgi:hypothetical protein
VERLRTGQSRRLAPRAVFVGSTESASTRSFSRWRNDKHRVQHLDSQLRTDLHVFQGEQKWYNLVAAVEIQLDAANGFAVQPTPRKESSTPFLRLEDDRVNLDVSQDFHAPGYKLVCVFEELFPMFFTVFHSVIQLVHLTPTRKESKISCDITTPHCAVRLLDSFSRGESSR